MSDRISLPLPLRLPSCNNFNGLNLSVPEARAKIAPPFKAGYAARTKTSPVGTAGVFIEPFIRPYGTLILGIVVYPPMNRWAILKSSLRDGRISKEPGRWRVFR